MFGQKKQPEKAGPSASSVSQKEEEEEDLLSFKLKLARGEPIPPDLKLSAELLRKLGVSDTRSNVVFTNLRDQGVDTWGLLLSLRSEMEVIEVAGNDRMSGRTIWDVVQEYKERKTHFIKERERTERLIEQEKETQASVPRFVSRSVQSVMLASTGTNLSFVPRPGVEEAMNYLLSALKETPSPSARNFAIPGFLGPMGVGKTRAAIEVCRMTTESYSSISGNAPLILHLRLDDYWKTETSESLELLAKALLTAGHKSWDDLVAVRKKITFGQVANAIQRDGFAKVLLHIDEVQVNREIVSKLINACLTTMAEPFGIVVIPILSGISLPNRKVFPSDAMVIELSLFPFEGDALLDTFCTRIGVETASVANSPNLRVLYDLCAGSPNVVAHLASSIVEHSSSVEFKCLLPNLPAEYASKIFEDTLKRLQVNYGAHRWHAVIAALRPDVDRPNSEDIRQRKSWNDYTAKVLQWLFCEAFLGEVIEDREKKIGTTNQQDSRFPSYSQCEESGIFSLNTNSKIGMSIFALMVLDRLVSVLPPGVNHPFDKNWETIEWVGGASLYLRLKLAQYRGVTQVPLSALRPDAQMNRISDIIIQVPKDFDLRFVRLGGRITGAPRSPIHAGNDGRGDPVTFSAGLIALSMPGEKAVDCIALLNAKDGAIVVVVNQSKERQLNTGNGQESESILHNGTIANYFDAMHAVAKNCIAQFGLASNHRIVLDVFSDRIDPQKPLVGLEHVSSRSYCITRKANFERVVGPVVGPGLSVLGRKRARLLSD